LNTFVKTLVVGTMPAVLAAGVAAALAASGEPSTQPTTQPTTQPATRPESEKIADSNAPLIIPDGTSRENPGPGATTLWQSGIPHAVAGIRH
jgi:hypothetical protein